MLSSLRPSSPRLAVARGFPLRAAVVVGLVLLAYNYSLSTLARGLGLNTPLAYLALVPVIALILAAARLRLHPDTLPIHDRQVDWIVGIGLIAIAAAVLLLVPSQTTSVFWVQRIDLLTMPIFVAGLIALLFGVRRVWELKAPLAFLLLAWPVPYTMFLSDALGSFTEVTARVVGVLTAVVPAAHPSVADPTVFIVGSSPHAFSVSVSSACAGVNSLVGFLLIGTALLFVVRGPILRRALWLAAGLALIFVLNTLRILAILVAGAAFGATAALDVLHPVAGLVVFMLGVIAMLGLVPAFGLRFAGAPDRTEPPAGGGAAAMDRVPVRRVRAALVVAVVAAAALGISNATYARYDAISGGLGDARLTKFVVGNGTLQGWQARRVGNFTLAAQYFGPSGTWDRYAFWSTPGAALGASRSFWVDVVTTDDPGSFAAYGLQACYQFHGYDIASVEDVEVGGGVKAQLIDYVNTSVNADWSALAWEWPYTDGLRTRYERVVVLLGEGPKTTFTGNGATDLTSQVVRFQDSDRFLTTLARTLVQKQLATGAR